MERQQIYSCGLDFGTSNSTLAIVKDSTASLVALHDNSPILKSSIFFDSETKQYFIGQNGINRYFEGSKGKLMLSLKSILGSSLLNEKTAVCGTYVTYKDIIGLMIKYIKETAEHNLNSELTKVVLGRPVRYHDTNDAKDRLAQSTMEQIAKEQGFKEVLFQFEPIAAALDYESTINTEQLAMIIDLGGGTSDFTIIRLRNNNVQHDRKSDILANYGIHVGGTNFDRDLSLHSIMPLLGKGSHMFGVNGAKLEVPTSLYYDLTTWHLLNFLSSHKTINNLKSVFLHAEKKELIKRALVVLEKQLGHYLLQAAENSKIKLSSHLDDRIDLSKIEHGLTVVTRRSDLEESCNGLIAQLLSAMQQTISSAGVAASQINSVFLTGGTTQIPAVQNIIKSMFAHSQFVTGDIYGSVGKGLAIEAATHWA